MTEPTHSTTTQPTTTGLVPRVNAGRSTSDPSRISAAARATQRSCWRSVPRARRNRTTSDPAPTTTARFVTAKASW